MTGPNVWVERLEQREAERSSSSRLMDVFVRMAAPDSPSSPWARWRAQQVVEDHRRRLVAEHQQGGRSWER